MALTFTLERIKHWPLARLQPYAKMAKLRGPAKSRSLPPAWSSATNPCLA